ncbi:MAG TPA: thiamine pyrophosphate-dependent enzyme [Gammaproteobacteria bacterium]|nr:thiamine pyrophosphate-dependent enzyme [Gammaproteobacteria bacterium]
MDTNDSSIDRASIIDQNFIQRVTSQDFPPQLISPTTLQEAHLSKELALEIFTSQIESRQLDLCARALRKANQGFYTIGSSGHEGNAAIAAALTTKDMAFLHYRSCAFMLQRARQHYGESRVYDHLLSLVAAKTDPISGGRHKVYGSLELNVPPQTSTVASQLPKAVGAAYSIAKTKDLKITPNIDEHAVILCSFGDASFNHSTAQGAFNAAQWINDHKLPLPIIFLCEDNGIGISVPTLDAWIANNIMNRANMQYLQCDGLNFCDVYKQAVHAADIARNQKVPVFLHMRTVRLLGHAGSDIEAHYRTQDEISAIEAKDPLIYSAKIICESGFLTPQQIVEIYQKTQQTISELAIKAVEQPKLNSAVEIMASIIPNKRTNAITQPASTAPNKEDLQNKNIAQAINASLAFVMHKYPNIVLFGEDVGKKGGVYRVTSELQNTFGKKRVWDTLLDEQTILGTAIGFAHNNILPIPEIQYLAFLHNAIDQIRGEAATLSFFSNKQFTNPMVIRIPGLGYQKGFGGHFHNENTFAALRDIPGIIIACPSTSVDAFELLQESVRLAQEEQRIVIFLEPIALYFAKDTNVPTNNGNDYLVISYGNGAYLSRLAMQKVSAKQGTLLDLKWLAPLNVDEVVAQVKRFKHILIVDECRKTASISEQILAVLHDAGLLDETRKVVRLTAEDSFITTGNSWQYLMPNIDQIIAAIKTI